MLETTSELLTLLKQEVNDVSPSTDTSARYLALLDRAHKAVIAGGGELNLDTAGRPVRDPFIFPWAVSATPKILTLLPKQEGTASVTNNSASVTASSINSATTNLTGYHVQFDQNKTTYLITLHSGTAITLDSPYVDSTNSSAAMLAFKLRYDVGSSDIYFPSDRLRTYGELLQDISIVDLGELYDEYPLSRVYEHDPMLAAIVNQSSTGNLTLQFSSYPSDLFRVELYYVPRVSTLTTSGVDPILPNYRSLLVHLAAYYHLRKRDDDRAQTHFQTAKAMFDALTTEGRQILNSNDEAFGVVKPFPGGFGQSSFRYFTKM